MFVCKDSESLKKSSRFYVFREKSVLLKGEKLLEREDFVNIMEKFPENFYFVEPEQNYASMMIFEKIPEYNENTIREYFSYHDQDENNIIARAYSLLKWQMNFKFCPKCGNPLVPENYFSAYKCSRCGTEYFPRIEPCIIVLVSKGDEMLLVRHVQRNQDVFVCIAGFIEAGENVESAVHREVLEEVGLKIKNLRYAGSQGWPFPDQLMLAFYADYESGEIRIQKEEIQEARWFKESEVTCGPKPGSVAYRLIHHEF